MFLRALVGQAQLQIPRFLVVDQPQPAHLALALHGYDPRIYSALRMPKSRTRSRATGRSTQYQPRQRRWVKWLGLLLPAALLIATLLGLFGTGTLGGAVPTPSPSAAS